MNFHYTALLAHSCILEKKGLYNKINNLLPDLSAPQFQEGRKCRDYSPSLSFFYNSKRNTMCRNLSHKWVCRPPVSRTLALLDPIHPESAELGARDQGSFTLNEQCWCLGTLMSGKYLTKENEASRQGVGLFKADQVNAPSRLPGRKETNPCKEEGSEQREAEEKRTSSTPGQHWEGKWWRSDNIQGIN